MPKKKDDLQRYIEERKKRDKEFKKNYGKGLKEFKKEVEREMKKQT